MFGAAYFGSAPFSGASGAGSLFVARAAVAVAVSASLTTSARLEASPGVRVSVSATFAAAAFQASPRLAVSVKAALTSPGAYGPSITIGGVDVLHRVRLEGFEIRDVLNDAPSTCRLTIEGDAPAVGQRLRVTIAVAAAPVVLFAGVIQSVEETYSANPQFPMWHVSAIDDTARANARRPFGTYVNAPAWQIAHILTFDYAPDFSIAGIQLNLPNVTITFDGSDTFIGCLTRLATAIGGYTKIEDNVVYLFLADYGTPPDPVDLAHPPLFAPAVSAHVDASQLRTRVYGKGYGEQITSDIGAGETLIPIQDGAKFPALGGDAIAGTTADAAQSERLHFTGVSPIAGGSLVGPGAAPSGAPVLALAGGGSLADGLHTVSVVSYNAGGGRTLAGPASSITVGALAPPVTAPTTNTPIVGTGPDQGSHDYVVTFVTSYGETLAGPLSNAQATSAAVGQLAPPGAPAVQAATQGAGVDTGPHDYVVTLVNANGETTPGPWSAQSVAGNVTLGAKPAIHAGGAVGTVAGTTGGNMSPNTTYVYYYSFTTAEGQTESGGAIGAVMGPADTAVNVPVGYSGYPDEVPRITGVKIYRNTGNTGPGQTHLVATMPYGQAYFDTAADASIVNNPLVPLVNTTAVAGTPTPHNRIPIVNIPTGPAGTTARRLYRRFNGAGPFKQVTTLSNNTATSYTDTTLNANLGAAAPSSNTTGTAIQQIPLTGIPLGPLGVTARRLYRRFNGAGNSYVVTTIANNTATSFTDTIPNASLGAAYSGVNTAIGRSIALSSIPLGPAGTAGREIYLSPAGGGARQWSGVSVTDNTTTTATLTVEPTSGILEPVADTSGFAQPVGQVNPGASSLPLAAASPFRPSGGWVILGGGQVVRYTGIAGQSLTGIPVSGPGSITTTVLYGSQALPSPMLVGVTGVNKILLKGSAIHIWVQRDDLEAQAEERARAGGDGVIEFLITDTRRGLDSLTARCEADLKMFARPIVTVGYATRDVKTKSGKPVTVNLTAPPAGPGTRAIAVAETLTIQDVTIDQIGMARGLAPRYTVRASSVRFSLEDTLRRLVSAENKGIR